MEIDWGTLDWALSQPDLKLTWEHAQSAAGQQSLESAPNEALFIWKRQDESVWSLQLGQGELRECINRLETEGVSVPSEFRDAFRHLSP